MADSDRSRFDYEPINSAPGLFSIYGCGLSLYGSRDKDPDTSSHVATRFITLVYFPLFAIGAFRIAKTAQGSFYLGKTTLSSVTRVWNYVVFAALLALFGTGYWQSHITSPEYIAEKRMEKVEVALSDQRIGDAAELLSKVFSSRTSFAIGAGEKLHLLVDTEKFQNTDRDQTLKAINILKRVNTIQPQLFEAVWPLVKEGVEHDPVATRVLLAAIANLGSDDELVARTHVSLLESLVLRHPGEQKYAIELALFYESQGRYDEIEPLLSPHAQNLGTTEGARVLGQQYAYENRIEASYELLLPYTTEKLKEFHRADKRYSAALDQVWDETLKYLNDGKAPKKFYRDHDKANEAEQQQMVDDVFAKRRDRSPAVKTALKNYQDAAAVAPVALDMGLVMLRRAQTLTNPEERRSELERAEETFLEIRGVAGESEQYRLYLAQVYYWLGKPGEGKALFEELLEARERNFETLYSVGSLLRDLGAHQESREIMLELYDTAKIEEEKYAAADFLSHLDFELDERIEWLKLADPNSPRIQADLNNLLGQKAEIDQDFVQAEKYYRLAVQAYETQSINATTFNNKALIYFSLYRVTHDTAMLKKGVTGLDEAIALDPSNSIILINAASELLTAAYEDLIGETFNLEKLQTRGYLGLLGYLYDDETEKLALGERLKDHPGLRKGLSYLNKALILAPKDPASYNELSALYYFLYDDAGLETIVEHLKTADLDLSTAQADLDAFFSGETDASLIEYYNARTAELKQQLETIDPKSQTVTHTIVSSFLIGSYFNVDNVGQPVDLDWLVNRAKENYSALPSSVTGNDLRIVLFMRAIERLRTQNKEIDRLVTEFGRGLDRQSLLSLAIEHSQSIRDLALDDPDARLATAIIRDNLEKYALTKRVTDWAYMQSWDAATADRIAQDVKQNLRSTLYAEIGEYLSPPDPASTYIHYWNLKLAGEDGRAIESLQKARESGLNVFVPQ